MIPQLTDLLLQLDSNFSVFKFLTLRAIFSFLSALLITLIVGPSVIRYLTKKQIKQVIRTSGPTSHKKKSETPTMGGVLIVFSIVASCLLWGELNNKYVLIALFTVMSFALIGGYDDYLKISLKNHQGLSVKNKFFLQSFVALIVSFLLYSNASSAAETQLIFPIFKKLVIDLGPFYLLLTYLVLVSSANSLNLTDGLDGLAIVPSILICGALSIFAYASGNIIVANYLQIPYIAGLGELTVFCAALVGGGFGFLWFNSYPAQIFMGDIGSLALGSALGIIAVLVRQEIVFFLMSGVLVMEALSVILQVSSYKLFGKRIWLMTPIHHHFELKGIPEPKIIVRFWIITMILVAIGLSMLKIR